MVNLSELFLQIVTAVTPTTVEQLLYELIALSASLTFFKDLDRDLQEAPWFKKFEEDESVLGILKYRASRLILDATHHWWAGLILMLKAPWEAGYWFGAGLFVADIPDFLRRLGELKRLLGLKLANNTS